MTGTAGARLSDGRLHFQHGPIDLILEAFGPEEEIAAAYRQAWAAFCPVLDDLVAVLPLLRMPVTHLARQTADGNGAPEGVERLAGGEGPATPSGQGPTAPPNRPRSPCGGWMRSGPHAPAPDAVQPGQRPTRFPEPVSADARCADVEGQVLAPAPARRSTASDSTRSRSALASAMAPGSVAERMLLATAPHGPAMVTPMAAVAGAVADHVLTAMVASRRLSRAYVNNGGDVALWLSPGTVLTAAGGPDLSARIRLTAEDPVRGIATSGWRGRSHSLGIADAVTVLARTASEADAAATLIANAVDLPDHPAICRRPARDLSPDSDLGERPVTVAVGPLAADEIARALAAGRDAAEAMRRRRLVHAAALWLGGGVETVGTALPSAGSAAG